MYVSGWKINTRWLSLIPSEQEAPIAILLCMVFFHHNAAKHNYIRLILFVHPLFFIGLSSAVKFA
jgi:hypothetical protein